MRRKQAQGSAPFGNSPQQSLQEDGSPQHQVLNSLAFVRSGPYKSLTWPGRSGPVPKPVELPHEG